MVGSKKVPSPPPPFFFWNSPRLALIKALQDLDLQLGLYPARYRMRLFISCKGHVPNEVRHMIEDAVGKHDDHPH